MQFEHFEEVERSVSFRSACNHLAHLISWIKTTYSGLYQTLINVSNQNLYATILEQLVTANRNTYEN